MKKRLFLFLIFIFSISCENSYYKFYSSVGLKKQTIFNLDNFLYNSVSFLFIVDDSGSMFEERTFFKKNMKNFLENILLSNPHLKYNFATISMTTSFEEMEINKDSFSDGCNNFDKKFSKKSFILPFIHLEPDDFQSHKIEDLVCGINKQISVTTQAKEGKADEESYLKDIKRIMNIKNNKIAFQDESVFDPRKDKFFSYFFDKKSLLVLIFISDNTGKELVQALKGSDEESYYVNILNEKQLKPLKTRGNGGQKETFLSKIKDENFDHVLEIAQKLSQNTFNELSKAKGKGLFKAYGILPIADKDCQKIMNVNAQNINSPSSELSYGIYPEHIYALINQTGGFSLSSCDQEWSSELLRVAEDIKDTVSERTLFLPDIPYRGLNVFYNDTLLENGINKDWYYDHETLSVKFSRNFYTNTYDNNGSVHEVKVEYHPVNTQILLDAFHEVNQ